MKDERTHHRVTHGQSHTQKADIHTKERHAMDERTHRQGDTQVEQRILRTQNLDPTCPAGWCCPVAGPGLVAACWTRCRTQHGCAAVRPGMNEQGCVCVCVEK